MPVPAQPLDAAIAQIAALEPIAGAGLAINLAYLALDPFRYRHKIEPAAEKACENNDSQQVMEDFHNLDAVKELKWLARRITSKAHNPTGRNATIYRYMFRQHVDVWLCAAATVFCGFVLVAGVAATLRRWAWLDLLAGPPISAVMFYLCILALAYPPVCVWLGRKCVTWGSWRIRNCTDQIGIYLKPGAAAARVPSVRQ